MKKNGTIFPEVFVIEPDVFKDSRGLFFESYSYKKFETIGIKNNFIQDNLSQSVKDTVRGLHFQARPGQTKLVYCTRGKIWDIVVDVRPNSPNFKKWFGVELSDTNFHQIFIPVGFAHGFTVLSDIADVQYKCDNYYDPKIERGVMWNDHALQVDWKVKKPILSQRDINNPTFENYLKKFPDPFSP